MQTYGLEVYAAEQMNVKQRLIDHGMTLIEVDKEAFAAKAREALHTSLSPAMQEVYKEILMMKESWK